MTWGSAACGPAMTFQSRGDSNRALPPWEVRERVPVGRGCRQEQPAPPALKWAGGPGSQAGSRPPVCLRCDSGFLQPRRLPQGAAITYAFTASAVRPLAQKRCSATKAARAGRFLSFASGSPELRRRTSLRDGSAFGKYRRCPRALSTDLRQEEPALYGSSCR